MSYSLSIKPFEEQASYFILQILFIFSVIVSFVKSPDNTNSLSHSVFLPLYKTLVTAIALLVSIILIFPFVAQS
jgi:uncharacterized membrane protein